MAKTARKSRTASRGTKARRKSARRILNCDPSRDRDKDWRFEHAVGAGLAAAAPVPKAKDLRAAWWKVGDQGDSGSCVGWATADSVLRWHFVAAKRIKPTNLLSPRFIWMASKETDEFVSAPTTFIEEEGTSLKAALDIARRYGAVTDKILPFQPGALYAGKVKTFYAIAAQLKIASYINLGSDLTAWRRWLAQNGPILTRLDVDRTWDDVDKTAGRLDRYLPATASGGHAIALVGYTPDMFVVRNSWGTGWGDKGFAYASNAYAAAAFTEAYGVNIN